MPRETSADVPECSGTSGLRSAKESPRYSIHYPPVEFHYSGPCSFSSTTHIQLTPLGIVSFPRLEISVLMPFNGVQWWENELPNSIQSGESSLSGSLRHSEITFYRTTTLSSTHSLTITHPNFSFIYFTLTCFSFPTIYIPVSFQQRICMLKVRHNHSQRHNLSLHFYLSL